MHQSALVIGVVAAAMAAVLTRPAIRETILDDITPSRLANVARTVCQAEAEVGGEPYVPCMHRLVPGLPVIWPNEIARTN
jgi:hypothetical protein